MESILDSSPTQLPDYTAEELQEIASQLEMNLETYKVRGKVTNIVTGPVITRFEVEPATCRYRATGYGLIYRMSVRCR